jgi:hypothetical protein
VTPRNPPLARLSWKLFAARASARSELGFNHPVRPGDKTSLGVPIGTRACTGARMRAQVRAGAGTCVLVLAHAIIELVTRVVHVPYAVEQDEDGVWCASAQLRPGVGAVGDGPTQEAAIADLRTALEALIDVVGIPDELTLTLNVA